MTLQETIAELYASEINASISWFWDGGLDLRLGDTMNGIVAATSVMPGENMLAAAAAWLCEQATIRYPNSVFAKRWR